MESQVGINPKKWGPHFWQTLFFTGLNYPVSINPKNKCHATLKSQYKAFYGSLQYTLPCIFCLESYRRFWKEEPIEKYLDSRASLMKWLYILKDKVNKKLIQQERQTFLSKKRELKERYISKFGTKWDKTTELQFDNAVARLKTRIQKTKQSPTWKQTQEYFTSLRS
jgi:hypothetical protein